MPHGEWRVRPGHVAVHLLKAIPARGLSYEDRSAVLERLRALAEHELSQRPENTLGSFPEHIEKSSSLPVEIKNL